MSGDSRFPGDCGEEASEAVGADTRPGATRVTSPTERLTGAVRAALATAGLPEPDGVLWDSPRQPEHGDYATNVAMTLARTARRPPRQIAELIAKHFPTIPEVERVETAGPGFLNVFLAPAWCTSVVRDVLSAGKAFGLADVWRSQRVRLEFVSANPTGPLVIVNARAAAVGDALARLIRGQGAAVTTEYYVNDAGNQFDALAASLEARVRQQLGEEAALPENGYPGEYVIDLARDFLEVEPEGPRVLELAEADRRQRLGRYAVRRLVEAQRDVLRDYGVVFDVWTSEQRDVRDAGLA